MSKPKPFDYTFVELEAQIAKLQSEVKSKDDEINRFRSAHRYITDKLNGCEFTEDQIKLINEYIDLESKARDAKSVNDSASANFSRGGESGSYHSPKEVIDLHFKWTGKSFEVCKMIVEKLGLKLKD